MPESFPLIPHPEPVLTHEDSRGTIFNMSVAQTPDGKYVALGQQTSTRNFGEPGAYCSSIAIADSVDDINWQTRPTPFYEPHHYFEKGLGSEDPRISPDLGGWDRHIFYNAARKIGSTVMVGVAHMTTDQYFCATGDSKMILPSYSPSARIKAAAAVPSRRGITLLFTLGTETAGSAIMALRHHDPESFNTPVTKSQFGRFILHHDNHHVLCAPDGLVRRGPELGAPGANRKRLAANFLPGRSTA